MSLKFITKLLSVSGLQKYKITFGLTKFKPKVIECITYTFISTSTPLGNSNFIKASIVFDEEL
jgi:hypothetical protein